MEDLQKFLSDIVSPYWWISVFVVGLLLSVFGNYLFKFIENLRANYSEKQRLKIEKRKGEEKARIDKLIAELENNPNKLKLYMHNALKSKISYSTSSILQIILAISLIVTIDLPNSLPTTFLIGAFWVFVYIAAEREIKKMREQEYILEKVLGKE